MKEELIYCKEEDVPLTRTRKAFLREFLLTTPATYNNDGSLDTQPKKHRSVSDLHKLVRSRFKKTSINAVMRILGELNNDEQLKLVYCNTINKAVIFTTDISPALFRKRGGFVTVHSKANHYETIGIDGYSLQYLEELKKSELNEED